MTELIDLIYEAAFVPECWATVLQRASDMSMSASAQVFFVSDHSPPRGATLDNMRPLFDEFIKGDVWASCDSMWRMCSLQPASFVDVDNFLTAEEIARDPARIMLRDIGIGAHLCTAIPMPTGEIATFVFQKWQREGGYEQKTIDGLNALRPHLARASLMTSRLNMERAQATISALDLLGLPAAVLRRGGNVVAANAAFEDINALFVAGAFGRLSLEDPRANERLRTAFERACDNDCAPLVAPIPIATKTGERTYVVHIVPIRRSARDIFPGSDLLLVVSRIGLSSGIPSNALVMALFDLSPAEARLALQLAAGASLTEAARMCCLSISSARTYLAHIFSKTGTHSQHQLVALLRSAGSLGPASAS